jgi:hypothetical protein
MALAAAPSSRPTARRRRRAGQASAGAGSSWARTSLSTASAEASVGVGVSAVLMTTQFKGLFGRFVTPLKINMKIWERFFQGRPKSENQNKKYKNHFLNMNF